MQNPTRSAQEYVLRSVRQEAMLSSRSRSSSMQIGASAPATPTSSRAHAAYDGDDWTFTQCDENDVAQLVVLHEPSVSNWMGSIHPDGSLYERPLDLNHAREEHQRFRSELEKHGVTVLTFRQILLMNCDWNVTERVALEDLATKCINYKLHCSEGDPQLSEVDKKLIGDEYKRRCVEKMSDEQLVDCILTNPTIELEKADKDTSLLAMNYTFQPLVNLVFTRDQVITTRKGIVLANLSSMRREREVAIAEFCYRKIGLPIIGQIPAPGKLEGGDFFSAGRDLCLLGVGLRSNMFAANHLMDNDLLGTTRFAVVKDYFDSNQQRMHLDTICNIVAPKVMLILEDVLGKESPIRRLVDEYTRCVDDGGKFIGYRLTRNDVEYGQYLTDNGYQLIHLSNQNQFDYGCNGLNIGNGHLFMVDKASAKKVARSPHFNGSITVLEFTNMTAMYGSLHCCSQVVSRRVACDREDDRAIFVAESMPRHVMFKLPVHKELRCATDQFLMIAPVNFYVNAQSVETNNFMAKALDIELSIESRSGRRMVREMILQDFERLHQVVTHKIGANVFLFTHETFHKTPEAVFCDDWFSTHSAAETGTVDTLVIYAMHPIPRRLEKRADIISMLRKKYTRVLNFSSCEWGDIKCDEAITSSNDAPAPLTLLAPEQAVGPSKALENGSIVRDRISKIVYVGQSLRASVELVDLWAEKLGYKPIYFNTEPNFFYTEYILYISNSFAVICSQVIKEPERSVVLASLQAPRDGMAPREIIDITIDQAYCFCCGLTEVANKDGKSEVIMSKTAHQAFTSAQLDTIRKYVADVHVVDVSTLESVGGGTVRGVMAGICL
eukprot:TRINITY_DN303_c0_g1_i5.p1 TRINITY_DN303_c0_g1~~TRINITY_DN303_c0_g1_i5.p1  ORF type:complete len:837 (-),score=166.55 TRINITY_DN303_c0_g1_i5:343-2853(-)